jgi:hypothetical protein
LPKGSYRQLSMRMCLDLFNDVFLTSVAIKWRMRKELRHLRLSHGSFWRFQSYEMWHRVVREFCRSF